MKRYVILAGIILVPLIIVLLWARRGSNSGSTETSDATPQEVVPANPAVRAEVAPPEPGRSTADVRPDGEAMSGGDQFENQVRRADEAGNPEFSFYGLVVDQGTNPLPNVRVDLAVLEEHSLPLPQGTRRTTRLERQTGHDGRFEVIGLKGKYVEIYRVTKEGYEQDYPNEECGLYGTQITGFDSPAVIRMWSTNFHEHLVAGQKSFVITPDGTHYAIDLFEGTIRQGDEGDLVAWIKRPENLGHERFDWSCAVAIPAGGLLESQTRVMFTAPETEYTNVFARQQRADSDQWGSSTGEKRFYVKLRNGQMYGRIMVNLDAGFLGRRRPEPARIQISYEINPSGSRLLR